jgi:hypothetical protein
MLEIALPVPIIKSIGTIINPRAILHIIGPVPMIVMIMGIVKLAFPMFFTIEKIALINSATILISENPPSMKGALKELPHILQSMLIKLILSFAKIMIILSAALIFILVLELEFFLLFVLGCSFGDGWLGGLEGLAGDGLDGRVDRRGLFWLRFFC